MTRAALAALAALVVACSGPSRLAAGESSPPSLTGADEDAGSSGEAAGDVPLGLRVANAEVAWLVAHLADEPDRAHGGDSDAVRRLARVGPEGVRAVAEVFRVGDAARLPFARRVVERVAERRCRHDRVAAAAVIRRLEQGQNAPPPDPDAGVSAAWRGVDDRWSNEAVERLRRWADEGSPCGTSPPDGGVADVS